MAEVPKFNLRNPAVKRIMQEIKEIKQDTSGDVLAEALETDIFEWHFVIRGPPDTEFDGGIYHGRILLPAEYPFKPPSFMMLTPNGRFETNMKICLSISSHHPEHWQPSWSVRTALTALVAFMPSPGAGALGALDFPKEERRVLAARSRQEPPRFGSADRQRVIDEMHGRMLALSAAKQAETERRRKSSEEDAEGAGARSSRDDSVTGEAAAADEQQQQHPIADPLAGAAPEGGATASASATAAGEPEQESAVARDDAGTPVPAAVAATAGSGGPMTSSVAKGAQHADRGGDSGKGGSSSGTGEPRPTVTATPGSDPHPHPRPPLPQPEADAMPQAAAPATATAPGAGSGIGAAPLPVGMHPAAAAAAVAATTSTDHMLTALMWALYVGIGAILLRKVMGVIGFDINELLQ